jgi:hypothetical protein
MVARPEIQVVINYGNYDPNPDPDLHSDPDLRSDSDPSPDQDKATIEETTMGAVEAETPTEGDTAHFDPEARSKLAIPSTVPEIQDLIPMLRQEDVTNANVSATTRETVPTDRTTAKVTVLRTCRSATTYG